MLKNEELDVLNTMTDNEIRGISCNSQMLISLNTLKNKPFSKIVVNNGDVVLAADSFELTCDSALSFFYDGTFTGQIDLESVICIKSNTTGYVNFLID